MADLILAYDIINNTTADAVPVQSNYQRTEAYINNNVIRTDGATVMAAPLQLFGDPVNANDAVRKGFLDLLMPVGVILPYGGVAVPGGLWALANGAALSSTVYPDLFAAMAYNFGGSGSSFNLPDLRGRTMMGRSAEAPFANMNAPGGSKDAALPTHWHAGEPHSHTTPAHTHPNSSTSGGSHQHHIDSQFVYAAGPHGSQTVQRLPAYANNNGLALQDSNGDGIPDSGGTAGMALTWQENEYVPAQWSNYGTVPPMATTTPSGWSRHDRSRAWQHL